MTNRNINQHGEQTTGLGVMIGRCSLDSQHESILQMLAVLLSGTQMDEGKTPRQLEQKAQLEETNQRVLVKKLRLKRYRNRTKQKLQYRTFQNNERKFYQQVGRWN